MNTRQTTVITILAAAAALMLLWPWQAVAESLAFTTIAGDRPGARDGTGRDARFNSPHGVAVDASGNVYVADHYNQTIRKISPAGAVTTLAGRAESRGSVDGTRGAARFFGPNGVAVDPNGNLYVADGYSAIRKITPSGEVTTLAGLGVGTSDGSETPPVFFNPSGVAVDANGNVYVADRDSHRIRKISAGGVVTTLAGWVASGNEDGPGITARFLNPTGVAVDAKGNVFVADQGNCTIRKISSSGVVTTLAGRPRWSGSEDGEGSAARFYSPAVVAVDASGNVFVADMYNHTIRKISPTGVVTTLAGRAQERGDANGPGSAACFNYPASVDVDASGILYVADSSNQTIRKVSPTGEVTTLAGPAGSSVGASQLYRPSGVAADANANLYISDGDHTIRRIDASGEVTTIAGRAGLTGSADGPTSAARFNSPGGLGVDSSGNVYVADWGNFTIRKVSPAGEVTTLAGLAGSREIVDGVGSAARFFSPNDLAVDAIGNVYVADLNTIRKINPAGVVTTLQDPEGPPGSPARSYFPEGVALDTAGNVYVAEGGYQGNSRIQKISAAGEVTTLAGGQRGSADGLGSGAQFYSPNDVAVDASGNVFVADGYNHTIRKINPAGEVSTVAGLARSRGSADGMGSTARFWSPVSLAVDASGNLFVADPMTIRSGRERPHSPARSLSTILPVSPAQLIDSVSAESRLRTPGA